MVKFEDHLNEIKETQRQISKTNSPQRKRELHRRLKKLWREYNTAKRYYGAKYASSI